MRDPREVHLRVVLGSPLPRLAVHDELPRLLAREGVERVGPFRDDDVCRASGRRRLQRRRGVGAGPPDRAPRDEAAEDLPALRERAAVLDLDPARCRRRSPPSRGARGATRGSGAVSRLRRGRRRRGGRGASEEDGTSHSVSGAGFGPAGTRVYGSAPRIRAPGGSPGALLLSRPRGRSRDEVSPWHRNTSTRWSTSGRSSRPSGRS